MHGKRCVVLLGSLLSIWLAPLAAAEPALLRAVDALDEPRGYCIDIPGSGPTLNLDAPLQGPHLQVSRRDRRPAFRRSALGSASVRASTHAASP